MTIDLKSAVEERQRAIAAFREMQDPEPKERAWAAAAEEQNKINEATLDLEARLQKIEDDTARASAAYTAANPPVDPVWGSRAGFDAALREMALSPGSRLKVPFVPEDVLREARGDTPYVLAGTTTASNYLIPTLLWQDLVYHMNAQSAILRAGPTIIRTPGDGSIDVPVLLTDATATAGAEVTAATNSAYAVFSKVTLKAWREEGFMTLSEEMARSSDFPFMQVMNDVANRALATKAATDYCIGAGSTAPDGLFVAVEADCTAGPTAAAVDTFTADELQQTFYTLPQPYRPVASWIVSTPAMKVIAAMKDAEDRYLWYPSLREGEPDRLFGRPIFEDAHADASGTIATGEEHVVVGDMSKFWISYAGGIDIGASRDMRFNEWEIVFRFALWHDCNVIDVQAFTALTQG